MSEDMVNEFVSKLFDKVLNAISKEWKGKTDIYIKKLEKLNKKIIKRNERLTDANTLWVNKHNQLIHAHNLEKIALNTTIVELRRQLDKVRGGVVDIDDSIKRQFSRGEKMEQLFGKKEVKK